MVRKRRYKNTSSKEAESFKEFWDTLLKNCFGRQGSRNHKVCFECSLRDECIKTLLKQVEENYETYLLKYASTELKEEYWRWKRERQI